jgi:hypothetical protein
MKVIPKDMQYRSEAATGMTHVLYFLIALGVLCNKMIQLLTVLFYHAYVELGGLVALVVRGSSLLPQIK